MVTFIVCLLFQKKYMIIVEKRVYKVSKMKTIKILASRDISIYVHYFYKMES